MLISERAISEGRASEFIEVPVDELDSAWEWMLS